jgi:hypothetical protein
VGQLECDHHKAGIIKKRIADEQSEGSLSVD